MLWKFQFLVESKKLEKVMWLLEGNVLELEAPRPVVNAKIVKGQVKAKSQDRFALVKELVLEKKSVTPTDMRAFMETVGLAANSYPAHLKKCLEAGLLGAKRPDGTYKVINKTRVSLKDQTPFKIGGNGTKATAD